MKKILLFTILLSFTVQAQVTKVMADFSFTQLPQLGDSSPATAKIWKDKYFYMHAFNYTDNSRTRNLQMIDYLNPFNSKQILDFKSADNLIIGEEIVQYKPAENYMYFIIRRIKDRYKPSYQEFFELWRTDGTPENTKKIDEISATTESSLNLINFGSQYKYYNKVEYPTNIGNKFYYTKYENYRFYLYETDGNITRKISTTYSSAYYPKKPMDFLTFNNELYFVSNGNLLVKYDGTNFTELAKISISDLGMILNNKLYFYAFNWKPAVDPGMPEPTSAFIWNKKGIYETDGTVAGTKETHVVDAGTYNNGEPIYNAIFKKTDKFFIIPDYDLMGKKILFFDNNFNKKEITLPGGYVLSSVETDGKVIYAILRVETQNIFDKFFKINEDGSLGPVINSTFFGTPFKKNLFYAGKGSAADEEYNYEPWRFSANNILEKSKIAEINTSSSWGPNSLYYGNASNPGYIFETYDELFFFATDANKKTNLYKFKGDFTFNNSTNDGSWNTPSNWNANTLPNSTDLVTIPQNFLPKISGSAAAGKLNLSSNLSLENGDLLISEQLKIENNSKLTLNANQLYLINKSLIIGDENNYVITNGTGTVNVENLNAERGTVNLPIGTATNYNPVSIANTGTSDTFSARVSEGIANTTNGAVNATWEISEATAGGSNVSLTLGWNTSQQNAAFDSGTAKVGHYLNGNWAEENSGSVSNNSITATGISSFSPFAVMNFGTLAAPDFSKSKVLIYPNPFNENLNISTENGGVVHFYDLSGKLVSTSILMKGTNSLNKSSLAKGVYIYQIRNTNGEILSSGKVIKK